MIIAQGAEAILRREGTTLVKERIKKSYRHEKIDLALRKSRTRREAKILEKANEVIHVPKVQKVDEKSMTITMDYLDGDILRDVIKTIDRKKIFKHLGKDLRKLHDARIIHGDLTTSNIILINNTPYFIDFGLSIISHKVEDKAVDLHLLRQALESKHHEVWEECFNATMNGYNGDKEFMTRFERVEGRGRYKHKKKLLQT